MRFKARAQTRDNNVHARQTHEDAKNARLNGSSPRGGATTTKQFQHTRGKPVDTVALLKFFESGGKREGVVIK